MSIAKRSLCLGFFLWLSIHGDFARGQERSAADPKVLARPDLFEPLTEPPCSYCVNQDLKQLVRPDDVVLAWIRGAHNGGAMPLRHFIAAPRVVNDTYGLFFYDPDGGYVASYEKDYGYRFYGWRGGVMLVQGSDGSLWSALSGRAIQGPQQGKRLRRIPSLLTTWQHWLMLHPESTAYDLFDGQRYPQAELPTAVSAEAKSTLGAVDDRLEPFTSILGIEGTSESLAVDLTGMSPRDCRNAELDGRPIAVFWYGKTASAVAFFAEVDGKKLTFYADEISPETAPFKDRETGTRWTLAGRAVDGELRGKELQWAPSIACRWYAWSSEYPQTRLLQGE
jgi:hypothetical protein